MPYSKEERAKYNKEYYLKNREVLSLRRSEHYPEYQERILAWPKEHRVRRREIDKEYKLRNPEKEYAHQQTHRAIKKGILMVLPCEVCEEIKVEGHHDDYSKPLEVRWLCHKHHMEHHRLLNQNKVMLQ